MRILLALVLAVMLTFSAVAPAVAVKGGSSGGKSSSSKKKSSDGDEEEEAGEEAEEDEGGCGAGTWIAFPILGGTVLVTRRRRRAPAS